MTCYLNDKFRGYLTPQAKLALQELENFGFDRDLSLAILEQVWAEDKIFELEEKTSE